MASPEEIAELRRLINEPVNVAPWTDGALSARLDARPAGQTVAGLAASIWREKAASYASLVDVKEGSSDRKLSQLYKQALDLAAKLDGDKNDNTGSRRRVSRTRRIVRL